MFPRAEPSVLEFDDSAGDCHHACGHTLGMRHVVEHQRRVGQNDADTLGPQDDARRTMLRGDQVEVSERVEEVFRRGGDIVYSDGQLYRYDHARGIWVVVPPEEISVLVQALAGTPVVTPRGARPLCVTEATVAGATRLLCARVHDAEFFRAAVAGIAFADCFVVVTAIGVEIRPHSEANRARAAYPFPYRAGEAPVELLRFLGWAFAGAEDAGDRVAAIQEFLGGSLLGLGPRYQRALLLLGSGRNGKSVLAGVMERTMPPGTVAAIQPDLWGAELHVGALVGVLMNIVTELPGRKISDTDAIKKVLAGDPITGRLIGRNSVSFRPTAAHVFCANSLPATGDVSPGFFRRMMVIAFPHAVAEGAEDVGLVDRIAGEVDRIVPWALAGAVRLIQRGAYTTPRCAVDARRDWLRDSDSAAAFVAEGVDVVDGPDGWTAFPDIDRAYRAWCHEHDLAPAGGNALGRRLRDHCRRKRRDARVTYYPCRIREWRAP